MGDPTIPRQAPHPVNKAGSRRAVPTTGRLVDQGQNGVWLVTARGDRSPYSPAVLQGTEGDAYEGTHAPPRLWKYDTAGKPTQVGDEFLVLFLENDPTRPVLLGGWRPATVIDPAFLAVDPVGDDADAWRWRKVGLGSGGVDRHVDVRVLDEGKTVSVEVGGKPGSGLTVTIDADRGRVTVSNGGSTSPVVNAKLLEVVAELLTAAAAIPPPNAAAIATLTGEINAEILAGSGAHLCSTLRAE